MAFKPPRSQLTLQQWKRKHAAAAMKAVGAVEKEEDSIVSAESHNLAPMFVPTRTDGNDFFEIITRKAFLNESIEQWLKWNMHRGLSVVLGLTTLWLFTINPWYAAVGGLATGWSYGWYWRWNETMNILKKRDLFESV